MDEDGNGISWGVIIFIIILVALAYNNHTSKNIEENYGYKVETSGVTEKPNCDSLMPSNLYDVDTGHYAGYEWGASGNDCGGNSDSFIQGCEEYQNQENAYQYCLSRNNH